MAMDNKVSFGERLDLKLPIPSSSSLSSSSTSTYEKPVLEAFLANPALIIKQVWDDDKVAELGAGKYSLKFVTIPVLNITPEIEVYFVYDEETSTVSMRSGDWRMLGDGNMKSKDDKEFLSSFDISLSGELSAAATTPVGWIRYTVSAKKPQIFRTAPFLLDGTIDFIKACVKDFVLQSFPREFRKSYDQFSRKYESTDHQATMDTRDDQVKIGEETRREPVGGEKLSVAASQFEVYETLGLYALSGSEKKKVLNELTESPFESLSPIVDGDFEFIVVHDRV